MQAFLCKSWGRSLYLNMNWWIVLNADRMVHGSWKSGNVPNCGRKTGHHQFKPTWLTVLKGPGSTPPHTITTDRQFSILFLTMSGWFDGVGPMMINIILHLKLLLTTTIFYCFWETKCLKTEISDHADSLPCGSWFSPVLLCGCGALAKPWHFPSLLDLSCIEEEEPPNACSVSSMLAQHDHVKCPAAIIPKGCCRC